MMARKVSLMTDYNFCLRCSQKHGEMKGFDNSEEGNFPHKLW